MKKLVLSMLALFGFTVFATAQTVTVADVEALQGQTVSAVLELEAPADTYTGVQLALQFPATGFTVESVSGWTGLITKGTMTAGKISISAAGDNTFTDATIVVSFTVDGSLAVDEYDVTVSGQFEGPDDGHGNDIKTPFSDATFKVTVTDRITLDETATVAPAAASGVNVKVKRTINANEWSTICLPFAMDETQVKAAFGNDVKLGDFTSWSSEEDGEGDIVAINVGFTDVTAIEANHPYIIKISLPIVSFDVDGVDIDPEDEPSVQVGKKKAEKGFMTGTYVANTTVPENNVFLYDGKFWYSKGNTKTKAFRAYFEFYDVLASVESSAPVFISFGGETTGIENIQRTAGDDRYYNLNGQHVENLKKGQIYIKNNKKVVVK